VKKDYPKRPGHRAPEGYDPGAYDRPSVACDCVIVSFIDCVLKVLLIERDRDPYAGYMALPGGFVEPGEPLENAAAREVREETGVERLKLIQVAAFGDPGRDPRTRVISIVYMALVRADRMRPRAGDEARRVGWANLRRPPELAFDHDLIIRNARERLKELLFLDSPRVMRLLPRHFPRHRFLRLCGEVMGRRYNDASFYRKMRKIPSLVPERSLPNGDRIYSFDRKAFTTGDFVELLTKD